jgi:hypothetical protein
LKSIEEVFEDILESVKVCMDKTTEPINVSIEIIPDEITFEPIIN